MRVLSLFDGMACGYEALVRAGIPVDVYYASEIDKYAIQIALKNHPDIIEIGDVCNVKGEDYQDIDLLIGGSPCQGFSVAGKMLNFEDPRSKLFFEYVRLLKEIKPRYFLLENVKMKKEFQDVISSQLGVYPIEIDSALVSGQRRKRLYWTNIPGITQPKDKGILLKDILQENVDEKYYFSKERWDRIINGKYDIVKRTEDIEGKCATLTTVGGGNHEKKIFMPCGTQYSSSDSLGAIVREHNANAKHQQDLIQSYEDKCRTIPAGTHGSTPHLLKTIVDYNPLKIRKLTPIECERLQTLPDNYTEGVSDSQRYKMLGNGWTCDVIAHIFSFMK